MPWFPPRKITIWSTNCVSIFFLKSVVLCRAVDSWWTRKCYWSSHTSIFEYFSSTLPIPFLHQRVHPWPFTWVRLRLFKIITFVSYFEVGILTGQNGQRCCWYKHFSIFYLLSNYSLDFFRQSLNWWRYTVKCLLDRIFCKNVPYIGFLIRWKFEIVLICSSFSRFTNWEISKVTGLKPSTNL